MANSKIYLGSTNIGSFFQGADDISIYLGVEKVYPLEEPVFQGKWLATYSDSHTESADCDASSAITEGEITRINLESVKIGDCVTSIGDRAFIVYRSLTSIEIPNSVTSIGSEAFNSCSGLTSISIPSGVTSISDSTFYGCRSLTSIEIPSGVTSIGNRAFRECSGLTSIEIPSGVTSIGTEAFFNCSGLTSITIEATTPPTLGTWAFQSTNNCPIYVPCESVDAYKAAWSDYASRITCPPFEGKWKAILSNGTTQSGVCTSSTVLNGDLLPTNTVNLEVGNCVTELYNFEGKLNSLSSCTISDSVTAIGSSTFYQKYSLKTVEVGSGVTTIGRWAFNSCNRLESLTFKSIVPPTLGDYVFVNTNNCPIYVPSGSVNTYKSASGWSDVQSRIQAIP